MRIAETPQYSSTCFAQSYSACLFLFLQEGKKRKYPLYSLSSLDENSIQNPTFIIHFFKKMILAKIISKTEEKNATVENFLPLLQKAFL